MVNPDWLRYFVTLAGTRNFHAAAERLHVTHQALSHAIGRLEAHFQVRLLDRGHRVRGLTPAGEAFLEEVRGIVSSLENLERRMAELRDGTPQGPVTMASVGFANHYLLPEALGRLHAEYPGIVPRIFSLPHGEIERWVDAGEIDLGVLLAPPTRGGLAFEEFGQTRYVIVGRPAEPRAWHAWSYVVPRPFMPHPEESLDGWPVDRFPRRVAAEADNLEVALKLCEAGVGVAFVPDRAVAERLATGALAVVAEAPFEYGERLYTVWRRDARLTPAVKVALGILAKRRDSGQNHMVPLVGPSAPGDNPTGSAGGECSR